MTTLMGSTATGTTTATTASVTAAQGGLGWNGSILSTDGSYGDSPAF
jgi:hypothetical protein